ncbi:MAG: hypothetical protein BroJett011_59470 [Chloroflexota bacterium]|nr:MAG: hypothetical protein BroJett011_59470 [Chloroflexota bacterium]
MTHLKFLQALNPHEINFSTIECPKIDLAGQDLSLVLIRGSNLRKTNPRSEKGNAKNKEIAGMTSGLLAGYSFDYVLEKAINEL